LELELSVLQNAVVSVGIKIVSVRTLLYVLELELSVLELRLSVLELRLSVLELELSVLELRLSVLRTLLLGWKLKLKRCLLTVVSHFRNVAPPKKLKDELKLKSRIRDRNGGPQGQCAAPERSAAMDSPDPTQEGNAHLLI
jgi:hypothetical protein